MTRYFDVIPIEDPKHSIFHTIERVGRRTGLPYQKVLHALGFRNNSEIKFMISNPPSNHFNIHQYLMDGLNDLLISMDIPLRITNRVKSINMKKGDY